MEKKIANGRIYVMNLQLDAAKAYPNRIFSDREHIRMAYSDQSKGEIMFLDVVGMHPKLGVQNCPDGALTARHPQVIFFVSGDYHVEPQYKEKSDPMNWSTWMNFVIPLSSLDELIDGLIRLRNDMHTWG